MNQNPISNPLSNAQLISIHQLVELFSRTNLLNIAEAIVCLIVLSYTRVTYSSALLYVSLSMILHNPVQESFILEKDKE